MSANVNRPGSVFAELSAMRQRAWPDTVDGTRIAALLENAAALEAVHAWAAEMQLGAEGFDNLGSARQYAEVQAHLLAAAQEIRAACAALERRLA